MIVKICGLTRQEDAAQAVALGAQMAGFIFHEKSPRYIPPQKAGRLETGGLARVGVFVRHGLDEIRRIMEEARLDYAQLHGGQDGACALGIGPERVIRVLWPDRYAHRALLQADMLRHADACAYFLLDAGVRGGGSGERLDWDDLETLRPPRPWLLAGGLGPANVARAIQMCHPAGVDFNSGVEDAPGLKSARKMAAAMVALRQAGGCRA